MEPPFSQYMIIPSIILALYGRGDGQDRKQRGLATLPIIARGILCVPVALVHMIRVIRSFAF